MKKSTESNIKNPDKQEIVVRLDAYLAQRKKLSQQEINRRIIATIKDMK